MKNTKESAQNGNMRQRETRTQKDGANVTNNATKTELVSLRRELGIFSCVGILVGVIIGSGIFISPKGVLIGSGSVGLTLLVWCAAGFYSFLAALCYTELGTLMPCSGGSYMYCLECFAPTRRKERLLWGPLPAFLMSWQGVLMGRPSALAIQGLATAKYIIRLGTIGCSFESRNEMSEVHTRLLALIIMMLIVVINSLAVKVSTRLMNAFTFAKTLGLLLIIVAGIYRLSQGHTETLKSGFEGSNWNYGGISLAFYSSLYAFGGWGTLNMVTREMKNPKRDFLKSIIMTMTLVTVLYVLANISYFAFMSKEELVVSDEVAVDVGARFMGVSGVIVMVLCVACSVFGASTTDMFAHTRLAYASAREGHMMEVLSYLSINYMTPMPALAFTMIIAAFMVWNSSILGLILATGFVGKFYSCISMIVLLVMRQTKKDVERAIKVPVFVPVLVFMFNIFLILTPLLNNPRVELAYGVVLMFLGVIVYISFIYYKIRIVDSKPFYVFIQKILLVAPPEDDEI